jgi:hypothetical protein
VVFNKLAVAPITGFPASEVTLALKLLWLFAKKNAKENNKVRKEIFWKVAWGLFVSNIKMNLGCKGSFL